MLIPIYQYNLSLLFQSAQFSENLLLTQAFFNLFHMHDKNKSAELVRRIQTLLYELSQVE